LFFAFSNHLRLVCPVVALNQSLDLFISAKDLFVKAKLPVRPIARLLNFLRD
jgi:hypothetical protein